METVLVTGGAGFIGSHTCDRLLFKGYKVVCVDNLNDYYPSEQKKANIKNNVSNAHYLFFEEDIVNFDALKKIFAAVKPDKIVHLAARAGVRPSLNNPFMYEETNIKGTLNLLELGKEFGVSNFIFGSSSSVYGENAKIPFSESDQTDFPISPYAATKKSGELLCYTYSHLYSMHCSCLRFFTAYGERGRPDMAPYLFSASIIKGKPITVFGDGTSKRDYTYVSDIVGGIVAALEKAYGYEIFNLGNSETVELKTLISTIEDILQKKAILVYKEMPMGDVPITYADITKSRKMLDYHPATSLRTGMEKFIQWYIDEHGNA
jgi:UDP-glucuronate 4-epimerase